MSQHFLLPTPWEGSSAKSWSSLRRAVPFDGASLLLIDPERPDSAAVLGVRGLTGKQVAAWLDRCAKGDALLKRAAKSGQTATQQPLSQPGGVIPKGMHAMAVTTQCAPGSRRYWALVLGRNKRAFTREQTDRARLALMAISSRFDTIPAAEWGMRRVIADADGRIMHVDTDSRLSLTADLGAMQTLIDDTLEIEAQRWPGAGASSDAHDLFPPNAWDESLWVRIARLPGWGRSLPGAISIVIRPILGIAPPAVGQVQDERVALAIALMCDEYAAAPSLFETAERYGVSPFHFHRLFNAQAQVSPKHLVLRVQLLHARLRLRTTRTPISQIAADCGFASHGHFTATFHRMVGVTPLDFRLGQDPPA